MANHPPLLATKSNCPKDGHRNPLCFKATSHAVKHVLPRSKNPGFRTASSYLNTQLRSMSSTSNGLSLNPCEITGGSKNQGCGPKDASGMKSNASLSGCTIIAIQQVLFQHPHAQTGRCIESSSIGGGTHRVHDAQPFCPTRAPQAYIS